MNKIDTAVAWCVGIANDDAHGYDNVNRHGPDYDCISLLVHGWREAGVEIKASGSASFHTRAVEAGFVDVTNGVNLKTGEGTRKGDLIVRKGAHAAMVVDENATLVEALWNELGLATGGEPGDQTGREIVVQPWRVSGSGWTHVFRWPTFQVDKSSVLSGNRYLSVEEMQPNASYIAAYLAANGWTLNAIAGMLGNMQHESTINPGIWQSLNEGNLSGGFGLVQWTPATKLIEWAESTGRVYTDIDAQLERILWELANGEQFYKTDAYPITFEAFTKSSKSPEYLAGAFLYNYERPKEYNITPRQTAARYWFNYLSGIDFEYTPGGSTSIKRHSLSLLLMWAATRRRF